MAIDVVEELHEDHYVDEALVLYVVDFEDGLVACFGRLIENTIEAFYEANEVDFGVVQPIGHPEVQHPREDVAFKAKELLKIIEDARFSAVEL